MIDFLNYLDISLPKLVARKVASQNLVDGLGITKVVDFILRSIE